MLHAISLNYVKGLRSAYVEYNIRALKSLKQMDSLHLMVFIY